MADRKLANDRSGLYALALRIKDGFISLHWFIADESNLSQMGSGREKLDFWSLSNQRFLLTRSESETIPTKALLIHDMTWPNRYETSLLGISRENLPGDTKPISDSSTLLLRNIVSLCQLFPWATRIRFGLLFQSRYSNNLFGSHQYCYRLGIIEKGIKIPGI